MKATTLSEVPISAVIPAYDRSDQVRETIRRLQACDPAPAEILIHLDNGADFDLPAGVRVLRSASRVGPGGGRNRMVREAACQWVASFDDDSYPIDGDFFALAWEAIRRCPDVGIIACAIRHRDPRHDAPVAPARRAVGTFVGCGCIYRKSAFLQTAGYVPLAVAYGMEEVDLALQLHALGIAIIETPELRVFHDTDLEHHESARITAGAIMNQALLAWVRYPRAAFAYGLLQCLNKVRDSLRRGRWAGSVQGLLGTPGHLWRHRALRAPVTRGVLLSFRELRRRR